MRLALILLAAACLPGAEMVNAERQVWTGGESWTVYWPADKGPPPWTVTKVQDRCELNVTPGDKDLELPFFEGHLKGAVTITGGQALTQEVELLGGDNVELGLLLVDAQNELLVYKRQTLKHGTQVLTWDLGDANIVQAWPMGGPGNRKADGFLKPWEQTVVVKAGGKPVKLRWGPARVKELKPLMDSVSASLATGHPINLVVLPEAREKPVITVANAADRVISLRCEVALSGWNGPLGKLAQELKLPAGGKVGITLPDTGTASGIRWADVSLIDGDLRRTQRLSYALMKPTVNPPKHREQGFLFSICTHASWWSREEREREYLAISLVGTDLVRDCPSWAQIESKQGTYDWTLLDEMMDHADRSGFELQGNTGNCTQWAASPEKAATNNFMVWLFSAPVRGWDAWERFNEAYAAHTKGRIRFNEIGNETDLEGFWNGTTDEYIRYLRLAYAGSKKGNPDMQVMTCGFSGIGMHDGKKLNPDMQQRVIAEAQDAFDIHAFHQHGFFDTFQPVVEVELPRLRSVLKKPKPLYFNETAMYCSPTISQRQQAEALYKKCLLAFGTGAIGFTWYDLRNDGTDPNNPEHNFGMITQDYHPNAVYLAFNTLTALLGEARCTGRLDLGAQAYGWRFAAPGSHVVAAWLEKPEQTDRLLAFRVGVGAGTTAASVDLMGVETALSVHDGIVLWPVTHEARFLVMRGSKDEPTLLPRPLALPDSIVAEPGKALEIPVALQAPGRAERVTLSWTLPEGLVATAAAGADLSFSSKKAIVAVMPGRRPAGAAHDLPLAASLAWSIPGTPWKGVLAVPVQLTLIVPQDGLTSAQPVFRMATRDRVTNFFDNDPSGLANIWKGPQDLSGAVWMGVEGDALVWVIKVEDDVLRQPNAAPDMWKSDSVQVGLMVPGQPSQWEFGFARHDSGKALIHTWMIPQGQQDPSAKIALEARPRAGGLDYTVRIPLAAVGLTPQRLKDGIRFNLIVNDDDTGVRKGWIHLAPGIGDRKDVGPWPEVRFDLP